jgi:UDP-N-acetylmuramoylalanine--D-glutamate ligase
MKVLVIGAARAGSSMAMALKRAGAVVTVVDQKPADSLDMIETMDKLAGAGIEVVSSWSGTPAWDKVDLIAPSPGVPRKHPALIEALSRGIAIWSEIEIGYRLSKSPIVAITGTNGKSTVTALTYFLLRSAGKDAMLCGNIAGSGFEEMPICDAASKSGAGKTLIAEVSSFQLEWVDAFRPHACAITNISEDHIGRYKDAEEYADMKRRIFENQTAEDFVVANLFDPKTFDASKPGKRFTYGPFNADVSISEGSADFGDFQVSAAELWAGGRHNLENAAAAWLLARSVDANPSREALLSFTGIANRMELIGEKNGVRFVNNTMCTNLAALKTSIDAAHPPVILLAGGQLDAQSMAPLDSIDYGKLRCACLYGRDGRTLLPYFQRSGVQVEVVDDLSEAFRMGVDRAQPGDTVFLSPGCKSFDQFNDFIQRGDCFRKIVHDFVEGTHL